MGLFDFLNKTQVVKDMTGSFGEWLAKTYSKIRMSDLVLHDVLIDGADGYTSQIDLLIVGNKGVYVVEVKNFPEAKIYGDAKKSKWYYYSHGKKYEIYSPLKQNKKHVEYLKTFLKDFGDVPVFSIVTMICDDFKISGEINKEEYIDTIICSSLPTMEKGIGKIAENKPEIFDDVKKQEIYDYIKNNQHIGKEARTEHKQKVIAYKDSLEEIKNQKICPYCKSELVLRNGKNGQFYGCKNFPKCRYTTKCD
jgi:transposase-like protein